MKYKALICDVDGTLMESGPDTHPTLRVKAAIQKAQAKIHIGIATARPYRFIKDILSELKLSCPSILGNGVQIFDPVAKKVIREHTVPLTALPELLKITEAIGVTCVVIDGLQRIPFTRMYHPDRPLYVYVPPIAADVTQQFEKQINEMEFVALHKMVAWDKGKVDYLITNSNATKQHAILEVAKILGIETQEIIGVGDGYNDFPLLMACGLKVAMGNAVDDLKAIADFVAPTVQEDGLAYVLEKFVLNVE